jgi:hypothetical protein
MKTETIESPPPAEVLIPEARQRQRARYRRRGACAVIAAFVLTALIVSSVLLVRGPAAGGKTQSDPKPVAAAVASGAPVYFRPVLCFAPADAAPTGNEPIPACAAGSLLSAANMDVTPSSGSLTGYSSSTSAVDPQYASYPSSSVDEPGYATSTVLLPGFKGACDESSATRCVLGPVEMSSRAIAKATVVRFHDGQWLVDYTTTAAGAAVWDRVADENFHQFLGIEVHGVVYSAPLMQPAQSSFSSFDGRGEISGNFTHADAVRLAKALNAHHG